MTVKTISVLPPSIKEFFNICLLTKLGKLYDDCTDLELLYNYIKEKANKKLKNLPEKRRKFEVLEKQFLELYERAKIKEKECKEKGEDVGKGLFDYLKYSGRNYQGVYWEIRIRARYRRKK